MKLKVLYTENKTLKGFTLPELLVTMALTTIMVAFAYMGYNQTQKILYRLKEQNDFLSRFVDLKKRLNAFSDSANSILLESDSKYIVASDSSVYNLHFSDNYITISKLGLSDTFKLKAINLKSEFEIISNVNATDLVKKIDFDIQYEKEVYHINLDKTYDGYSKLLMELKNSQ